MGIRITADAASDPDFNAFTALLGNNQPDQLLWFFEQPPSEPGIGFGRLVDDTVLFPVDWSGYRITSLSFVLSEYAFDATRPTPILGETFFTQRLAGELSVFGEAAPVPEPTTLALLGLGLGAACVRRRRALSLKARGK